MAFKLGADGVLICGCHPGECHYAEGNHKAARRVPLLKQLLAQFGIEPERLRLEWVSASEGERFAKVINEMTTQIRELGPLFPTNDLDIAVRRTEDVPEPALSK
jgi:F420-non-reducing hydrogenase iron-sulfur subunit